MTWFEVQLPHKKAMGAFYGGLAKDPLLLLSARGQIIATAGWLLALAESDFGNSTMAQAAALSGILGACILVWLKDDDPMERTMAKLDRDLRRVRFPVAASEDRPDRAAGRR